MEYFVKERKKLKRLLIGLSSLLLISIYLTACQGTKGEQVDGTGKGESEVHTDKEDEGEEHNHDDGDGDSNDHKVPEDIKIEGVADHYHTGDMIDLTAVLNMVGPH
ncbi:hypothetical protein MUB24_08560 [Lederbergia sp. NSJ-179]|uniref:hypothetical protein n=1 Tax=Lederbergia sp. NSJ-179 TaxID=2931402 RepID=UPI001FD0757E|nr:hypothetical protein [Lederbergia sp. NSJ-179]MCJ7840951.1 hypothetical protein [Lederbergia sp. NSJ-179]